MFQRIAPMAIVLLALASWSTHAAPAGERADLEKVVKSLQGVPGKIPAHYYETSDSYLRFISAPPGTGFKPSAAVKNADAVARAFVAEHGKAFGVNSARVGFSKKSDRTLDGSTYVRLQQRYMNVPVIGAEMVVQVNSSGAIQCVVSDILRDTASLDTNTLSMTPTLTAAQAVAAAVSYSKTLYPNTLLTGTAEAAPMLYAPDVVGNQGPVRLVWSVVVTSPAAPSVKRGVYIDAHTGAVAFHFDLIHDALSRKIYDANSSLDGTSVLSRAEGHPPVGQVDVDAAYDYLGDTYQFFFDEHGRDGIDGIGSELIATVRFCDPYECPMQNAFWDGYAMYFGEGYTTDDITGHELTHGVTQYMSNLIYYNESGAINESMSDIWGEFIDLTNGKGDDTEEVRWLMGEEAPGGAIRNMSDPTKYEQPDRYSDYLDTGYYDNGGVHVNSGISNKMAYLLTDGGLFNDYAVKSLGISTTAKLFYGAQELLTEASEFEDLGLVLVQAAQNLNFDEAGIDNVRFAARAVEIMPREPSHPVRQLRALSTAGDEVQLAWDNPVPIPAKNVILVRRTDRFADLPVGDGGITAKAATVDGTVLLQTLTLEQYVDSDVVAGQEYFYSIFSQRNDSSDLTWSRDDAHVVAGEGEKDFFTESFVQTDASVDYSQITFDPTVDWTAAYASGQPQGYVNYLQYVAHTVNNVHSLPVDDTDAVFLDTTDDGIIFGEPLLPRAPIPFFGEMVTTPVLGFNGFLTTYEALEQAALLYPKGSLNFPSQQAHFEIPRISLLFCDLSPLSGGTVWVKDMADRYVVTFYKVPQYGSSLTNTAQLELFYNGRIRMTFLEVNATNAIVGLSDGNGTAFTKESVLSELNSPAALTIEPIAPVFVNEAERVSFNVVANSPSGVPIFMAGLKGTDGELVDLPAGAAFTPPIGSSTAASLLDWTPSHAQSGYYTIRVQFTAGDSIVSQDVLCVVGDLNQKPTVAVDGDGNPITPLITPYLDPPVVDGQPSYRVRDGESLVAEYTYSHPEDVIEGGTRIYWFQNGLLIPAFQDLPSVPATATSVGDVWQYYVKLRTLTGIEGDPVPSVMVTIVSDAQPDVNKDGKIDARDIQITVNAVLGVGPVARSTDVNGDRKTNALDIQLLVNEALGK